jgi:hypothetical protein
MLAGAVDDMPEDNERKRLRLVDMIAAEAEGRLPDDYVQQERWIGDLMPFKARDA